MGIAIRKLRSESYEPGVKIQKLQIGSRPLGHSWELGHRSRQDFRSINVILGDVE
jgi:hypothetical protein